jgi:hypothetical protein
MAYQPEVVSYDAGVYQLEVIDPVDGGVGAVSNAPLLNLANRTAYLYQHVTNLENGTTIPPTVAPLNNANLTGTPTAPTPALGDNSTKISTTAFVQGTVNGLASINVAGGSNVTLTSVQAGNGILVFTGALTANIAVIVPASTKTMIVENLTSGAYTLTVKTASGTGVAVTQGKTQELFCDGTNVLLSSSDFVNVALTGTATAPTAATGDQSTKVATTNFVYQLTNGVVTVNVAGGANVTLTAAQYGNGIVLLTGALTASIQVNLPSQGGVYVVANKTTGAYSINLSGGAGTNALVPQGQSVVAYCDGSNVVLAGAAASSAFSLYTFTATAGQTTFNCPYTPGNIAVIVNGAQISPANYTATNGSSVVLSTASVLNDDIQVVAYSSFTVANALPFAGGTMAGPIMMAGGDTGVTAAQFDNSTLLATTAFVKRQGLQASNVNVVTGVGPITPAFAGSTIVLSAAGSFTVTMNAANSFADGARVEFINVSPGAVTIAKQSGDLFAPSSSNPTTFTLNNGDSLILESRGSANIWYAVGGSAQLKYSSAFGSFLASPGYQKLPSGLIIQWGSGSTNSSGVITQTLPTTFPTGWFGGWATVQQSGAYTANVTVLNTTTMGITGYITTSGAVVGAGLAINWIAIGY